MLTFFFENNCFFQGKTFAYHFPVAQSTKREFQSSNYLTQGFDLFTLMCCVSKVFISLSVI